MKPTKPKRFLVFGYSTYYPAGGWHDLKTSTDILEEAQAFIRDNLQYTGDVQIVDLETGEQCQ